MSQKVVRWRELSPRPWRNGGGSLRAVASGPAGADSFDWTVSIAEIEADGPFSDFPGIDRVLMLVDGTELLLDVGGEAHRLGALGTLAFPGDVATSCRVPSGPARALNLMTRRGRTTGSVRMVVVGGHYAATVEDGRTVVLVALTTGMRLEDGTAVDRLDSVVQDEAGTVRIVGEGTLAELTIG